LTISLNSDSLWSQLGSQQQTKDKKVEYIIKRDATIDKGMISEIIDTAGYSIAYWATSLINDEAGKSFLIEFDGDDFEEESPLTTGKAFITYQQVAKAVEQVANNEAKIGDWLVLQANQWLNGEPTLDGDLADVIIQVATFGELVYG
jgi:hypothetical protein